MNKNKWIADFVKDNYLIMGDRAMAIHCNVGYVTIFNIRKKYGIKRPPQLLHEIKVKAGFKGGSTTQIRYDTNGHNNSNWKNGASKNHTKYFNTQKNRFPKKIAARRAVINARRRGDIERLPCVVCGEEKSFAHHEDYSKPLEIIWLCRPHHMEKHLKV